MGASETEPPTGEAARRGLSRRGFLGAVGGATVGAAATASGFALTSRSSPTRTSLAEPFYGTHQGGVTTRPQSHTVFAAFDVESNRRADVAELLRSWTATAANLTAGRTAAPLSPDLASIEPDSGDALDLGPARLTVNFGFGPTLFSREGVDRFGLASRRPAALVDLPRFVHDELIHSKTGGDLTIHACADDPQVAFHAVRQLARAAEGVASVKWLQTGFNEAAASHGTPRNLMGFKDGTINPRSPAQLSRHVWVGTEGPAWMRSGTYLVARRIRISLEHWDAQRLERQENTIGRHKLSGAPLGARDEFSPLDLTSLDAAGQPVIPIRAHVRLAAPAVNDGEMILRRSYAYNDGVDPFSERWLPYRRVVLFDAGLFFCAYQRDPRRGFIPIYEQLSSHDALGEFTTHTGSVIVALPPASPGPGRFVGEGLFD